MTLVHHPVFARFAEGRGPIPNWVGVTTRRDFFSRDLPFVEITPPAPDPQYLEWVDVLEAVIRASDRFTMIELGAGYGRWIVNAAAALRSYSGLPYMLVAVEAEPTHYRWLRRHCRDNGIRRFGKSGRCRLIRAAVAAEAGRTRFLVGQARDWYGQALAEGHQGETRRVRAVTLSSLRRPLATVDLIHLDVQGAELDVLNEARDQLARVRRVHVGTHGVEVERGLRTLFGALGWMPINDYASNSAAETPWGAFQFEDGIQTWVNPTLDG